LFAEVNQASGYADYGISGEEKMTRYERIRQEIIAIEREIAALRHVVRNDKERETFKNICVRNEQIRDSFSGISQTL
jgi:hypothetical protein